MLNDLIEIQRQDRRLRKGNQELKGEDDDLKILFCGPYFKAIGDTVNSAPKCRYWVKPWKQAPQAVEKFTGRDGRDRLLVYSSSAHAVLDNHCEYGEMQH